ncbi:MAG: choice-of-anchor A family protein [Alphaproteobacteria bacterium]|nr:choice-of-anchor A family protein [Alphaproteobacteria bacterium]
MPVRGLAAFIGGAVLLGLATAPASATTLTASSILGEFNAVVFHDVSGSCCDVEGPVVIGGNLSGGGTFFNRGAATLPTGYGTANVYGNASGHFNANGAQVYVAGTNSATFSGGSVHNGASFADPFSAFQAPLVALSHELSLLTANSTLPAHNHPPVNNGVIKATPGVVNGVNGIAVFNITAADLADFASFSLDVNAASTVVLNVSGNYTQTANIQNIVEANRTKVIWNFYDATILNLTRFEGAVLAPYATVHNASPIEGTLVASAFDPGGELHYHPFTGDLSFLKPTDVPEPVGTAVLGVGLLGLIGLRMARRK